MHEAYRLKTILRKWMRFIIPFIPVYLGELYSRYVLMKIPFSLSEVLGLFINGAGPGSYYFIVMLQLVLIIPLIVVLIRRYNRYGLVACFMMNLAFEVLKEVLKLSTESYRLCSFRYLFIVAYGVWLWNDCKHEHKCSRKCIVNECICGIIGFAYLVVLNYTSLKPIKTTQWTNTSLFGVLLIVPVMRHLIKIENISNKELQLLGISSYEIFLVQMLYYGYYAGWLYDRVTNTVLQIAMNFEVCCILGIVYYRIENPISKKIMTACG